MDRRRRILDNPYEAETHRILSEVATKYGARVFPKVRIMDVLDLDKSGISGEEYTYALKAHFDFTVANEDSRAQFAVEFDGRRHAVDPGTIRRDALKDAICEQLGFPLLRIGDDFFRRIGRFILLGWLAEVWFLEDAFNMAQQQGQVPFDEIFDYAAFLGFGYLEHGRVVDISDREISEQLRLMNAHAGRVVTTHPYNPFAASHAYISRTCAADICRARFPEELSGIDPAGYHVAVAVLPVGSDRFIIGHGRVKMGNFHAVPAPELAFELSIWEVAKLLMQYQENTYEGETSSEVESWRRRIAGWRNYR